MMNNLDFYNKKNSYEASKMIIYKGLARKIIINYQIPVYRCLIYAADTGIYIIYGRYL